MAQRRRESREFWAKQVAAWQASGLAGGRFAERHGLNQSTLYRWAKVLGEKGRPPRFTQVVVKSEPARDSAVEVVLRTGRLVRVRGPVDAAQLQAVVAALESC